MKLRWWFAVSGTLCLLSYVFVVAIAMYQLPTPFVLAYGTQSKWYAWGPPQDLVIRYVICCKDVGEELADEFELIPLLLHGGSKMRDLGSDSDSIARAKANIRLLIERRNLNVNWVSHMTGLSALHRSVMSAEPWEVEFLLELGADPCTRVTERGRKFQGLNSLELANRLYNGDFTQSPEGRNYRQSLDSIVPMLESVSSDCEMARGE